MSALISACGRYRYTLRRTLDFHYPLSTACVCGCMFSMHYALLPRRCTRCDCRGWMPADPAPACLFVMLNPSTADAENDDPTIRRCIGYGESWGYGEVAVGNLHALRTPSPKVLEAAFKAGQDVTGPDNDQHLLELASRASLIVCAWGNHGTLGGRDVAVRELLRGAGHTLHYLSLTKTGQPEHPLYKRADLKPTVWA